MLFSLLTLTLIFATPSQQPAGTTNAHQAQATEDLWSAARAGDTARVGKALDAGADVNARTRYGATALTFAADKGHLDVVKLLIERGADVNAQDSFYKMRAIDMALMNKHLPVAELLLQRGSKSAAPALMAAVQNDNPALATAALASPDLTRAQVVSALAAAKRSNRAALIRQLEAKLGEMPEPAAPPAVAVDAATLQSYVGTYRSESLGMTVSVSLVGEQLTAVPSGQPPIALVPTSPSTFRAAGLEGMSVSFAGRGGTVERMLVTQSDNTQAFERVASGSGPAGPPSPSATAPVAPPAKRDADTPEKPARTAARAWPGFRGHNASGDGDGQGAVVEWDVETGRNVLWKTSIPGISNASPIISGNRAFVITAISSAGDKTFRTGLYGDVAPVHDVSEHTWKIYALDSKSGRILWDRVAFTGLPKVKRHTKASQANSTPATDGKRVVALFGSIGLLLAWDMEGKELWRTDVGVLDSGWFFDPDYQWGHSSSPVIYRDRVIVQADRSRNSFIAAYALDSGKQIWRTERDEISTWGTPTLFSHDGRDQIVTNGTTIRAYDPQTGKLLWTLGPNSEVTVGTPVVGDGLVFVTGGYPPVRPIYAVKPTASGEIVLSKERPTHEALAWTNTEGTYIPSPLVYRGVLYTCSNNGVLSAYETSTGKRLYRARVGSGGSFSASPVAADGRLYLANEDGDVYVVSAGQSYQELAKNEMKEVVMATPAVSDGVIVIRTLGQVYGIGAK